ncbi:MAG: hypothetical protein OER21_03310 [Gemmatimonadota bacterium]|nr:hypothetical protein [Gemmatimonadota bacterium]
MPYRTFGGLALIGATAVVACSNPNALPPAQVDNVIDTTVLFALSGTPLSAPSAFNVVEATTARTDRNLPFDFAFDIAAAGTPLLYPPGSLGLFPEAGILVSTESFAGVLTAPREGYVADSAVAVAAGSVFVVRSRSSSSQCALAGSLPRYGKFHVLGVDLQQRTITLEFLINRNCGYRGLEPGLPAD